MTKHSNKKTKIKKAEVKLEEPKLENKDSTDIKPRL